MHVKKVLKALDAHLQQKTKEPAAGAGGQHAGEHDKNDQAAWSAKYDEKYAKFSKEYKFVPPAAEMAVKDIHQSLQGLEAGVESWDAGHKERVHSLLGRIKDHLDKAKREADIASVVEVRDRLEGDYLEIYGAVIKKIGKEPGCIQAMQAIAAAQKAHPGESIRQSANSMVLLYSLASEVRPKFHEHFGSLAERFQKVRVCFQLGFLH